RALARTYCGLAMSMEASVRMLHGTSGIDDRLKCHHASNASLPRSHARAHDRNDSEGRHPSEHASKHDAVIRAASHGVRQIELHPPYRLDVPPRPYTHSRTPPTRPLRHVRGPRRHDWLLARASSPAHSTSREPLPHPMRCRPELPTALHPPLPDAFDLPGASSATEVGARRHDRHSRRHRFRTPSAAREHLPPPSAVGSPAPRSPLPSALPHRPPP